MLVDSVSKRKMKKQILDSNNSLWLFHRLFFLNNIFSGKKWGQSDQTLPLLQAYSVNKSRVSQLLYLKLISTLCLWKLEIPLDQKKVKQKPLRPQQLLRHPVTNQGSGRWNPEPRAGAPPEFRGPQEHVVCVHDNSTDWLCSSGLLKPLTQLGQRSPLLFLTSDYIH